MISKFEDLRIYSCFFHTRPASGRPQAGLRPASGRLQAGLRPPMDPPPPNKLLYLSLGFSTILEIEFGTLEQITLYFLRDLKFQRCTVGAQRCTDGAHLARPLYAALYFKGVFLNGARCTARIKNINNVLYSCCAPCTVPSDPL